MGLVEFFWAIGLMGLGSSFQKEENGPEPFLQEENGPMKALSADRPNGPRPFPVSGLTVIRPSNETKLSSASSFEAELPSKNPESSLYSTVACQKSQPHCINS